jgi:hypothetical protein
MWSRRLHADFETTAERYWLLVRRAASLVERLIVRWYTALGTLNVGAICAEVCLCAYSHRSRFSALVFHVFKLDVEFSEESIV